MVSDNKKYNEENCSNTTGNLKKSRIAAEELRDETLIEVSKQASTPDRQEAILKMPKLISRSCKLKNTFPDKHENNSIDNHISKAIEINNRVPEFHKIYQVITEKCYVLLEDSVDNSSLLKNLSEKFSSINESVNLKKPSMNENPGGGQNPLFSTSNDCIDDLIKGYKVPSSESNGDPLRKLSTSSTPQLSKEDFKNNECLPKQPASFNLQPSTFIKESLEMTSSNTKISILKPSKLMMSLEINSPMSVIPTESLNILSSATKESAIPKYQQKMIKHEVPIKDKEMRLSFCKEPLKPTEDSFQNEPRLSGSTVIQMTSSETGQSTKPLNTASEGN